MGPGKGPTVNLKVRVWPKAHGQPNLTVNKLQVTS